MQYAETIQYKRISHAQQYDELIDGRDERDGEWHDFYIPMSRFASTLANMTCTPGVNVFGAWMMRCGLNLS